MIRWFTVSMMIVGAGMAAEQQRGLTLVSQVADPVEQRAFLDLYASKDPAQKHTLAQAFINRYPQSWLLAQACDAAARASIDLGNYQAALGEAHLSLRILRENPSLLVLVANVEAKTRQYDGAITDARDALEYLDQFVRPGSLTQRDWDQLKSSAYFALGRSFAATGRAREAEQALDQAAAWNNDDAEVFYLRAMVETALHEPAKAAADLAFVAPSSSSPRAAKPFIPPRDGPIEKQASAALSAGYAGSAACQTCHAHEYTTWRETGMARMLRPFQPQNVIGDFSPGTTYKEDGTSEPAVRMGVDSRPYFDVRSHSRTWTRFHVDYTIGSKWQQGYATRLADGSFQVLPIEYNRLRKAWVNYWEMIDPSGSQRTVIADFPELRPATNYQENCAVCHTSQLRAATGSQAPLQHATFREGGVDCEMCHGPSALHVKQMRSGIAAAKPVLEPPVDFRRLNNKDGVRVCAQCHAQAAVRKIGNEGEMNYSADTSYVPKSWSRNYDEYSRRAFYKDGRFRETTFLVEAFTRSACYRRGSAQCASCHAPHVDNFSTNLTSLKYRDQPNEMCLDCHSQIRAKLAQHTHHQANSEASQCVSCHMPRIVNALLFKARSHEIGIPGADLTERFGQSESPNACLLCHAQKDAHWVQAELRKW